MAILACQVVELRFDDPNRWRIEFAIEPCHREFLIIASAIVPSSPAKSWIFVILGNKIEEFLTLDVRIADFVTFGAQIIEFVIVSSRKVVQGHLLVVEN